jgi:WW domain-containing oxidoreductase
VAANNSQLQFGSRTSAYDVVAGRDLSGRTIIVTGANSGIGEWTARALASAGARVIFACRHPASGQAAVERARAAHPGCKAAVVKLDLASFAAVRRFAEQLDAERIDTLICNAGLVTLTWAESHRSPPKLDFDRWPLTRENFRGMIAYGQAKLCNLLMAKALQSRYGSRDLVACALHPGTLVMTGIGRHSKAVGALIKLRHGDQRRPKPRQAEDDVPTRNHCRR